MVHMPHAFLCSCNEFINSIRISLSTDEWMLHDDNKYTQVIFIVSGHYDNLTSRASSVVYLSSGSLIRQHLMKSLNVSDL